MKFKEAGIPLVAMDTPIPGAPYVCINNWYAYWMMGKFALEKMKEKWGSPDKVDLFNSRSILGV